LAEKADLVITALQQRIGELVSNYEIQSAILRAEITQLMDEAAEKEKLKDNYVEEVQNIIKGN